jgi:hypothetical protein
MSDKSITEKLLIKTNYKVLLIKTPPNYRSQMGNLPTGAAIIENPEQGPDLVQAFVTSKRELEEQLATLKPILKAKTMFWVTYPKGTSKIKADINRDTINAYARTIGLIGIAMVSIDDTWSALRLKLDA